MSLFKKIIEKFSGDNHPAQDTGKPTCMAHGLTDQGLHRKNNEDCFIIDEGNPEAGLLYVVADGMGGYAAGETASRLACHRLREMYFADFADMADEERSEETICRLLETIVYDIHIKLIELAEKNIDLRGMGTTLSALLIRKNRGIIVHVGDSRIYRFRNGQLKQLTTDHTELQQYIENGQLTREEAATHHLRHILSQAIGGKPTTYKKALTLGFAVEPGDLFLLCSDGLYDMTGDAPIQEILAQDQDLPAAADKLCKAALALGGKDNITIILVKAGAQ